MIRRQPGTPQCPASIRRQLCTQQLSLRGCVSQSNRFGGSRAECALLFSPNPHTPSTAMSSPIPTPNMSVEETTAGNRNNGKRTSMRVMWLLRYRHRGYGTRLSEQPPGRPPLATSSSTCSTSCPRCQMAHNHCSRRSKSSNPIQLCSATSSAPSYSSPRTQRSPGWTSKLKP